MKKNKRSRVELSLQTDLRVFCVTKPFFFCPRLRIVSIFDNWSVFEILKALGLVQISDFLHFLPWKSKTEALKWHDILIWLLNKIINSKKWNFHCNNGCLIQNFSSIQRRDKFKNFYDIKYFQKIFTDLYIFQRHNNASTWGSWDSCHAIFFFPKNKARA